MAQIIIKSEIIGAQTIQQAYEVAQKLADNVQATIHFSMDGINCYALPNGSINIGIATYNQAKSIHSLISCT